MLAILKTGTGFHSQRFSPQIDKRWKPLSLSQALLRNPLGHSGWQTTRASLEGPPFQNPIRQNSEQYYLCVCVCTFITLLMNKLQPCGMVWWRKWWKNSTHITHSPVPSHCLPPFTIMHTHTPPCAHTLKPQGSQCSWPVCPSAHAECWAGSTYHHSAEWRPHKGPSHITHTRMCKEYGEHREAVGRAQSCCGWLNVWCDSSLSWHWEESLIGKQVDSQADTALWGDP